MIRKIAILSCLSLFFMCNDDDGNGGVECTAIKTPIEVVYPKGGETFKVGETKTIEWKVNPTLVGQVVVEISIDNEKHWSMIYEKGIDVPASGNVACMNKTWEIGKEVPPVNYASTNKVNIRVGKYGAADEVYGTSAQFIVNK